MYSVSKGPIFSSGDLDIEETDGLVLFLLHGELDEWMLRVEVLRELVKCCLAMGPNHEGVINMRSKRLGRRSAFSMVSSLNSSMNKSARTGDRGDPMAAPEVCS